MIIETEITEAEETEAEKSEAEKSKITLESVYRSQYIVISKCKAALKWIIQL